VAALLFCQVGKDGASFGRKTGNEGCVREERLGGGSRRKEKGFLGLGFFFVFFFKCAKLPPPFCVLKATIYRQKILLGLKLDLSTFFFYKF